MIALSAWSWPGVGSMSPARRSCPRPRLLLVASAWRRRCALRRSRSSCPAARSSSSSRRGAGEERLFAGGLVVLVVGEVFVDEVDHEQGVDDPDAVGEVLSALVDVGEASGAGAVAGLRGDLDLERLGLGAGGEGVELAVELVRFAGEDVRELVALGGGEVRAGALDLLGGVEQAPSSMRTA